MRSFDFLDILGMSDIVYAVDETSPTESLHEMKNFVNEAVEPFDTEKGNARIALVKYGAKPSLLMDFSNSNKAEMNLLLDTLTPQREESNPIAAIKFIQESFFEKKKARDDAAKTLVMLINGDKTKQDLNELEGLLKSLNNLGVGYVLIITGGPSEVKQELKQIGERYGRVHLLDSSSQLPEVIPDVIKSGKGKND